MESLKLDPYIIELVRKCEITDNQIERIKPFLEDFNKELISIEKPELYFDVLINTFNPKSFDALLAKIPSKHEDVFGKYNLKDKTSTDISAGAYKDYSKEELLHHINQLLFGLTCLGLDLILQKHSNVKLKVQMICTAYQMGLHTSRIEKQIENKFENRVIPDQIALAMKQALSKNAKKAVEEKLKKDPKQAALKNIETEFNLSKYPFQKRGYRAKFCKEMIEKYPIITDIKTIERLFDKLKKDKNTPSSS